MSLPKKYKPEEQETHWQQFWEKENIFAFDLENTNDKKKKIFSIDTPPPTISGKMHIGHAFSYTQQDIVARYKRMSGFNVYFPFGTDDNGLPTERLVEKKKGVKGTKMPRHEFVKLCQETIKEERVDFVQDWKNIGMSCDWNYTYSTVSDHVRKISQQSFLNMYKKDRVYKKQAPVMWDPFLQTAIAQAELEEKEVQSQFNHIIFKTNENKDIIIATTRPELLAACVAVFCHPNDDRYKELVGQELLVPFYHFKVKVLTDERVLMDKGTGIVMCCTFGDQNDIEWYRAYDLPLKAIVGKDGRMTEQAGKELEGKTTKEARKEIITLLKESKELIKEIPITHAVKVGERSGAQIEIIESPQWFVKYLDLKDAFLERSKQLNWQPEFMKSRLDNWIKGLQWDWCISRQRHFGVPFPMWYSKKTGEVILADESQLPVDPLADQPLQLPEGHTSEDIIAETDVMDTWATSSLSPDIALSLLPEEHRQNMYPMDLRPQGHDIISFWLFNTLVKAHIEHDNIPFKKVNVSGWVLDPKGKKMSKSKGNTISPQEQIKKYSADALRFAAAGQQLGSDLPFPEKDLVTGKKTVTKLFNASKFAAMFLEDYKQKSQETPNATHQIDAWMLTHMQELIQEVTQAFEAYEYQKARNAIEKVFWNIFCDNYIEFVKDRLYNTDNYSKEDVQSGQDTLFYIAQTFLQLYAPLLPFVTEELYQGFFKERSANDTAAASIHTTSWPTANKQAISKQAKQAGDLMTIVVAAVRKYKSTQQVSLKKEISKLTIACSQEQQEKLEQVQETVLKVTISQEIAFTTQAQTIETEDENMSLGIVLAHDQKEE